MYYRCFLNKMSLQRDRNGWLLLSTNFTSKCGLVFVLTGENANLQRFDFKANRKSIGSSKKQYQRFLSSPFKRSAYFHMTITGNFERFYYSNYETSFLKKSFFVKLEDRFLVESTTMENTTFTTWKIPHFYEKLPFQKPNVKTNRMGSTKWTYYKERSFANNYFIFWQI